MLERLERVSVSVSATTRPSRAGETDGVDYHFMSRDGFLSAVERDAFLEYAEYAGNLYGTLASDVEGRLGHGDSVVLEIELQGARMVRAAAEDALAIFIEPPSFEELESRLRGRGTDAAQDIARRLSTARIELDAKKEFHEVIVNDDVDRATNELVRVLIEQTSAVPKGGV